MAEFESAATYIACVRTPGERIKRIDQIIDALMDAALTAAETGYVDEYMLDDGQTKINQKYKSPEEIGAAIKKFQEIRNLYVNQAGGAFVKLVDRSNFKKYGRR